MGSIGIAYSSYQNQKFSLVWEEMVEHGQDRILA